MTNKKQKKGPIALLLVIIAAIAGLIANIETIENFIWPDKKTCDANENAISVATENLKNFNVVYFEQKTIDNVHEILKTYFEHESCKSESVDNDISEIKKQLDRMVGELLDSLSTDPDEKNKLKLNKCLEILKLACSQGYCSEFEQKKIDDLIKIIQ